MKMKLKLMSFKYLNICLIASAKSNNIKVTKLLISKGADINAKDIIFQIVL